MQRAVIALVAVLFSVFFTPIVFAQSVWTGNAGTSNWNTPGNWTGGVPAAGKTVTIYQCTTCPVINTMGNEAAFVQVYAGGKLTIGTGSLAISNPGGPGMKTQTNSQVNVSTGASLTIQNFWGEGLSVQGALNNNGTVTINGGHTGVSVVSGGAFANGPTGSLSISGSSLNYGLVVEGGFNNQNVLSIDDANNDGIHVKTGTTLNLGGIVSITRTGVNGIYSRSTVNLSGNLAIDNALNGIYLIGGIVNNDATAKLTISGSTFLNDGIFLDPGTFNNNGELAINNAQSKGMEISSASTFNNFNKITLNVPAWAGIFNVGGSNFMNKPCALIESNAAIVNYANFTNKGIIKAPNGGGTSINTNHGALIGNFTVANGNAAILDGYVNVWTGCASTEWNDAKNWYRTSTSPYTHTIVQDASQASGNSPVVTASSGTGKLTFDKNAQVLIKSGGSLGAGSYYDETFPIEIKQGAVVTIQANGKFAGRRVMVAGKIQNAGEVSIPSPWHSVGNISLAGGSFINQLGGKLITDVGQYGAGVYLTMTSMANLENSGTISIGGAGNINLSQSSLKNLAGATITIGSMAGQGLVEVSSNSTLQNMGSLTCSEVRTYNSSFNNGGTLQLSNSEKGIWGQEATYSNTGTINMSQAIIILYGGSFNNAGTIQMANPPGDGLVDGTQFTNSGTLKIEFNPPSQHHAVMVLNGASFTNTATGNVLTKNMSHGLINWGNFINRGTFKVDGATWRGIETNSYSNSPFLNDVGATLTINGAADIGLAVFQTPLINAGRIEISNTAERGLYLSTPFENLSTGKLVINQVGTYALNSNVSAKNYGTIDISNSILEGIACVGQFENFASGVVTVLQNQPSVWPSISNGGSFYNAGTVNFLGDNLKSVTNGAVASFVNRQCGILNINGLIINNNSISNQGFFKTTFTGANLNPGTFTNTGVIEDFNNSFNGVAYSNSAFRIRPINGTVGGVIYNAVEAGGTPPIVIGNTWYKDQALTQSAGIFNSTMNSFTPTVGVGTHTLYFTVKDLPGNCTKTVSVKVSIANAMIGRGEKAKPDIVLFNYPNPFVNETRIKLSLPFDAKGKLVVYDQFGRLVTVVYEGEFSEGELYEFSVDASTMKVASYVATLVLDTGRTYTARMVKADNL